MRIIKTSIILFIVCSASFSYRVFGEIPEKLANFNLNNKRESEKTGVSFHKAVEATGAVNRGIFVSKGGYIKIPTYPSFRTQAMMPELNLDIERGCLEFRFSPTISWRKDEAKKILFAYNAMGGNNPSMTFSATNGKFTFAVKDEEGQILKAESATANIDSGKFYHIALFWSIDNPTENSILKIYLDGKKVAEAQAALNGLGTAPADFFIGSENGKNAAVGTYDEIKIWNVDRNKFDMSEDSPEEKLKNAKPLLVENFNDYPDKACVNDKLLGKCLVLPATGTIKELPWGEQGMIEFWLKPLKLNKDKVEICCIGKDVKLDIKNGKLLFDWQGCVLKTESSLRLDEWNAVSLMWNLRHKNASLFLNGKKQGTLTSSKRISPSSRLTFSFKNGQGLLKGIKIWNSWMPKKNAHAKGFRLTGNFNASVQALLEYDVPALTKGHYIYSNAIDGIKDISLGKGPFSFAEGKLTDGKIGAGAHDRVSFYKSREIVFDLGKVFHISEVLAYCVNRPNWYTKNIEFSTSIDGKKWTPAGKVINNAPDYTTHLVVPYENKIDQKARLLKLYATPKPGYLVSISEVLIFGRPETKASKNKLQGH
jgi:concanavalin A-like lectin/glucanase superfamily protein